MSDTNNDTPVMPRPGATTPPNGRERVASVQLVPVTRMVSRPSVQVVNGRLVPVLALAAN
jgi:hypothetical protein